MLRAECRPVLALALEELDHAKTLFVYRLAWHLATLACLISAAYVLSVPPQQEQHTGAFWLESAALLVAVFTECVALWVHHRALEAHTLGRQVMRRVMLLDAERPEDAAEYHQYIKPKFTQSIQLRAEKRLADDDDPNPDKKKRQSLRRYYFSNRDSGPHRLRDHLLESALFSRTLYQQAFRYSLLILAVFLLSVLSIVLILGLHGIRADHARDWGELSVRLAIVMLSFLPACQELDHALVYRMMSKELSGFVERLKDLWDRKIPPEQLKLRLTAAIGDYGAATTLAPPIRSWVYWLHDAELSKQVEVKFKELEAKEAGS
jgi:hypothetical protein